MANRGIKGFKVSPRNPRDWNRFLGKTLVTPSEGEVTPDQLAPSTTALIQTTADDAADEAVSSHEAAPDPHPVYATDTALTAHVSDPDPHPGYVLESTILNGSTTYDPASLNDGVGATTTVTVTGASLGNFALASFSLDLQGITLTAWVSAADTVSVRFQNESGGVLDLGSGILRARVWT